MQKFEREIVSRLRKLMASAFGDSRGAQTLFAEKCGLQPQKIHNILAGKHRLSLSAAVAIAKACKVSLDWLVFGRGPQNNQDFLLQTLQKIIPEIDENKLRLLLYPLKNWEKLPFQLQTDIRDRLAKTILEIDATIPSDQISQTPTPFITVFTDISQSVREVREKPR